MRILALLAAAIVLAGCAGEPAGKPLTDAEARVVADKAMQDLAGAFGGDGDLRRIVADLHVTDPDLGTGDIRLDMEWGSQGTAKITATIRSGGISFAFTLECGTDRQVVAFGGERLEARPTDDCDDPFGQEGIDAGFDPTDLDDLEQISVTPNDDGTVTAVYQEEGVRMTMHVDRNGRITRMDMDGDEATGTIELEYGAKRLLTPGPAAERMPTSASAYCFYFDGACQASVSDGDDAPLSEFQVRIFTSGADPEEDSPIAVIPLAGGSSGDWNVAYQDDGDGRFGEGDTFTVTGPDADVDVVVWDTWADKDIHDVGAPGPWMPLLLVGLLGAALQRRTEKP